MITKYLALNSVINNPFYKNYCRKICSYRDISNDLYQEFILILCEKKDEDIIKFHKENILKYYCISIIMHLNYSRNKPQKKQPCKNNLFELTKNSHELFYSDSESVEIKNNNLIAATTHEYNNGIDETFENVIQYLNTNQKLKELDVAILFESVATSMKKTAKNINIPYITVHDKCRRIKLKIKENVSISN